MRGKLPRLQRSFWPGISPQPKERVVDLPLPRDDGPDLESRDLLSPPNYSCDAF